MLTFKEEQRILIPLQLKRLALILYSGDFDQYANFVPLIQEKLVEILKTTVHSADFCMVFLCLRVLATKISSTKLRSLWPLIVIEMIRIFGSNPNTKAQSDIKLIIAATKFLDLILVLNPEQFKIHEWIFISDDPMFSNRGSNYTPLLEINSNFIVNLKRRRSISTDSENFKSRPIITSAPVSNEQDLKDLLANFTTGVKSSVNGASAPDMDYITLLIEKDFMESKDNLPLIGTISSDNVVEDNYNKLQDTLPVRFMSESNVNNNNSDITTVNVNKTYTVSTQSPTTTPTTTPPTPPTAPTPVPQSNEAKPKFKSFSEWQNM